MSRIYVEPYRRPVSHRENMLLMPVPPAVMNETYGCEYENIDESTSKPYPVPMWKIMVYGGTSNIDTVAYQWSYLNPQPGPECGRYWLKITNNWTVEPTHYALEQPMNHRWGYLQGGKLESGPATLWTFGAWVKHDGASNEDFHFEMLTGKYVMGANGVNQLQGPDISVAPGSWTYIEQTLLWDPAGLTYTTQTGAVWLRLPTTDNLEIEVASFYGVEGPVMPKFLPPPVADYSHPWMQQFVLPETRIYQRKDAANARYLYPGASFGSSFYEDSNADFSNIIVPQDIYSSGGVNVIHNKTDGTDNDIAAVQKTNAGVNQVRTDSDMDTNDIFVLSFRGTVYWSWDINWSTIL